MSSPEEQAFRLLTEYSNGFMVSQVGTWGERSAGADVDPVGGSWARAMGSDGFMGRECPVGVGGVSCKDGQVPSGPWDNAY